MADAAEAQEAVKADAEQVKAEAEDDVKAEAPFDAEAKPGADAEPDAGAEPDANAKAARPETVPLATLGLAIGDVIEVLWEVEMSDGTDEAVWWAARVEAIAEDVADGAQLVYAPQHGFEEEARRVLWVSEHQLWDALLRETMPWRREGEAYEVPAAEPDDSPLPVGATVKARFQGGERFCAGSIAAAHEDGTYDVLYEDQVMEEGVPRDVIELVDLEPSVQAALDGEDGEAAAEGIDSFFEMFVAALTGGAAFQKLSAERQAIASDKVKAMMPFFEAELKGLRDERGWGAMVTGEDIKTIIPKVLARSKAVPA